MTAPRDALAAVPAALDATRVRDLVARATTPPPRAWQLTVRDDDLRRQIAEPAQTAQRWMLEQLREQSNRRDAAVAARALGLPLAADERAHPDVAWLRAPDGRPVGALNVRTGKHVGRDALVRALAHHQADETGEPVHLVGPDGFEVIEPGTVSR